MKFTVPPFSGKNFRKNRERVRTPKLPCAICGRPLDPDAPSTVWAIVIDGGAAWGTEADEAQRPHDPGYMGGFPVGPDCARRYSTGGPR